MVIHIRGLEKDTLASRIYEEQRRLKLPGLAQETEEICRKLSIEDCNISRMGKSDYRKLITSACHTLNEEIIRKEASAKKCTKIKEEEYGKREYMNSQTISNTRNWFKSRFFLQPFAGNFSKDKRFASTDWMCRCKESKEEEGHITSGECNIYGDLKTKFGDLKEDNNLVDFFRAVLDRRDQLEEEDRTR